MTYSEGISFLESLIPATIGGTLCVLALLGTTELIKEAKLAFKKGLPT